MATGQHLLSQQQHPIADPRLHNVRLIVLLTALLGWPNASSCDNSLLLLLQRQATLSTSIPYTMAALPAHHRRQQVRGFSIPRARY